MCVCYWFTSSSALNQEEKSSRTNSAGSSSLLLCHIRKHVMTHAQKKGSLSQYHGEGQDHIEGWSHGKTRSLREGKSKRNAYVETWTGCKSRDQSLPKRSDKMVKIKTNITKRGNCESVRRQRVARHRKLYPLRGRGSTSENQASSCHVMLSHPHDFDKNSEECQVDTNRVLKHTKMQKSNKKTVESRKPPKTKTQEPRKRRLASLNAEAVNSLLLERPEGPPGAKLAKKQVDGSTALKQTKTQTNSKQGSETLQNRKQMKKFKKKEKNDNEVSLFVPAPRRLAGLNAAALLKLTSSAAGNKQRLKMDNKGICAAGKEVDHCKPKVQISQTQSWKKPELTGDCIKLKSQRIDSKLKFEGSSESQRLTKTGYQSRSMLGYPLKVVREEKVEAELSPYFCCPPEGSVEYCHRLALFLGQKAYGETEKHPVTSVKHECLVPPHTLAHQALTLRAHPCLCADPCYSSYYIHIAHPGPPTASLSARPLPCTHSPFCPRGVSGAKLLASSVSHASGVPHPPFCTSVGSPCFHEACGVNRCSFRALQPVSSRPCTFTTNCSHCSHSIKTEGYSSSEDDHSQALLPPAVPLSGCSSSTGVARLLSSLSDCRHTDIRLKAGKECLQNTKPSNESLAIGQARLSQKMPTVGPAGARQKKVSRRRVTNGWHPVGEPTEKEIFIVGQDETVLRQCFEGVQRDGEVIRVRDTVLLRSGPRKKSLPYVAKISSLWTDPRSGELMMSLFWYYRPEHTQGGRDPSMHCENEIFASRHQDENSVACIEDRCYVLPLAQYCRFCALVKRHSEGVSDSVPVVPGPSNSFIPSHRLVPDDVDPDLVYLCRNVYDFRYGRILKNLQ